MNIISNLIFHCNSFNAHRAFITIVKARQPRRLGPVVY